MAIFSVLCSVKYSQEITLNINDFLHIQIMGGKNVVLLPRQQQLFKYLKNYCNYAANMLLLSIFK